MWWCAAAAAQAGQGKSRAGKQRGEDSGSGGDGDGGQRVSYSRSRRQAGSAVIMEAGTTMHRSESEFAPWAEMILLLYEWVGVGMGVDVWASMHHGQGTTVLFPTVLHSGDEKKLHTCNHHCSHLPVWLQYKPWKRQQQKAKEYEKQQGPSSYSSTVERTRINGGLRGWGSP